MLAVIALTLEFCVMLAAWGVSLRIEVILLVELLLVPFVLLAFVGRKFFGKVSCPFSQRRKAILNVRMAFLRAGEPGKVF